MSLMSHSKGEYLATREQLMQVPTPAPQGPMHHPVPYGDFIEMIDSRLKNVGAFLLGDEYIVKDDGSQFFGLMEVALEGEYISAKDWSMQIGVRGSHDKSLPRAMTFGSHVFVCSNLAFHGELGKLQVRHTTNVMDRLPGMIDEAVSRIPVLARRNIKRFDAFKIFKMKQTDGDAALVEIYRRGGLNLNQLGTAINEWAEPSFEAHAEDGFTAWRLFNAATQALKSNQSALPGRSIIVSDFVEKLAA